MDMENVNQEMEINQEAIDRNISAIDLPDIEIGTISDKPSKIAEPDAKEVAVKFGIIGTGQGGSRLSDIFYQTGYRRVCAINTTPQDFLGLTIPITHQKVLQSEGGAGKDITKGSMALHNSSEEVMNLMYHSFGEDIDRIIITVGLGGGSGTGSVLGLIKLAKYYLRQLGKEEKVGAIVSLPKKSEGGRVQANSYHMMNDLLPMVKDKALSPFVIADNESIHQMFPDVAAKMFWSTANKNIIGLFDVFNVLACQKSAYVTFDRSDYQSMLDSGVITFGATKLGSYQSETDISDGLRNNLKRNLLADLDLTNATHAAAILCAPDGILSVLPQSHIDLAFTTLERIMNGENKNLILHQGVYETRKIGLYLYTMCGGLDFPRQRLDIMKARGGI